MRIDPPKDKAISYKPEDWPAAFDGYFLNIRKPNFLTSLTHPSFSGF
jgi:hypothetical protein